MGLKCWLSCEEQLFLQRTWVQVPVFTWQLITIGDSTSRGLDTLFWPPWTLGTHVVYSHTHRQNTPKIKSLFKEEREEILPFPILTIATKVVTLRLGD